MNAESFIFKGDNGQDAFCWYWGIQGKPKGLIQIIHGLAEHAERYADIAGYLNTLGFVVYACDLRGHGRTGEINHNLGDLDHDGFNGIMRDQHILSALIREKHPEIPLFILAHSFGSFIGQEYIKNYSGEITGVILSGSCWMGGPLIWIGHVISTLSLVFGKSRPNRLLDQMSFGSFNKRIHNPESKFDWTSRDKEQVKKYDADNFCGFVVSSNFFYYFFKGLMQLKKNTGRIPKDLPVYLMSGAEDPVGQYSVGVTKLYEKYKSLGINDLEFKLYPGCRHETINEINQQDVYRNIAEWLQKHCSAHTATLE